MGGNSGDVLENLDLCLTPEFLLDFEIGFRLGELELGVGGGEMGKIELAAAQ